MRRIMMFNRVTADGYFAGADGNLNWVVPDEEIDKAAAEQIAEGGGGGASDQGTILFGRRTYDLFESFWPRALDESATAPNPHDAQKRSREMHAMAVWINQATKVVFSKTRKQVTWKNSRLVPAFDPRELEAMKKQPGKDIIVFGSGSIVSQLTQHGLIDEYRFIVCPLVLGSGRPMISGVPKQLRLDLQEAKAYPSGNVMLRYVPQR